MPSKTALSNSTLIGALSYRLYRGLSARMLMSLFHARIEEFLSRVSSGRVFSRFSSDLFLVDKSLMYYFSIGCNRFSGLIVNLSVFAYSIGAVTGFLALVMLGVCFWLQRVQMKAKREFIRLRSISKSPSMGHVLDTFRGLPVIRSGKLQDFFRARFAELTDDMVKNDLVMVA